MKTFKITNTIDGEDDAVYIEASTQDAAMDIFHRNVGQMPANLLKVVEIDAADVPRDEDVWVR